MLNKAIAAVEDENDALAGVLKNNIDFNAVKGKTKIPDQKWKDLLDHFNQPQFVLVNDNFEFPDLLGAAYEYLIKYFADSAGKKGGEFYTPAEVVRLLVQLTKPEAGNEIYDPTAGSGALDDLARRRVKIALLDDLNDPFELVSLELSDQTMRRTCQLFMRKMAQRFGVICFSKQWNNPVLWSHYAEKHKGVCLGFDVPDNCLLKVRYTGARLPNKIKADLEQGGLDDRDMREILTTKFKDWAYENEMRVFLRLEERETETGLYFKDFSGDLALREIILGPRCVIKKSAITETVGSEGREMQVIKARLAFNTFRVVRNKAS